MLRNCKIETKLFQFFFHNYKKISYITDKDIINQATLASDGKNFLLSKGVEYINENYLALKDNDIDNKILKTQPPDITDLPALGQEISQLSKLQYKKIFNETPNGSVRQISYKSSKITLISTNFSTLPLKNIYRLLSYTQPDVVLLQIKPDNLLENFKIHPINKNTLQFNEKEYITQLFRNPADFISDNIKFTEVCKELENFGVDLQDWKGKKFNLAPFVSYDYVNENVMNVAALYCHKKNLQVVLGGLPEEVLFCNTANMHTALQLENILKASSREVIYNPDIQPSIPILSLHFIYPEIFLNPNNQYLSTLIEVLVAKGFKKITCFLAPGHSESLPYFLRGNKIEKIKNHLKVSEPTPSIVNDVFAEDIIEKNSILDVLQHGADIMNNLKNLSFKRTYKMIFKYADPSNTDSVHYHKLRVQHVSCMKHYAEVVKKEQTKAKEILERFFISKSLD